MRKIDFSIYLLILLLLTTCGSHYRPVEPDASVGLGDINRDSISYSIADFVMLADYFVYGSSALPEGYVEEALAASDVNGDGVSPSVADLAYMSRVIAGDALPYGDPSLKAQHADFYYHHDVISVQKKMGAAAFVFYGDVEVLLLAPRMELKYHYDGENTRAVVYSLNGSTFTGDVVRGSGLMAVEFGSAEGCRIVTGVTQTSCVLGQNYPNPFNPSTIIPFSIPEQERCTLTVRNSINQIVFQMDKLYEAGRHTITYCRKESDASGYYYYTLTAGDFTDTRKMMLQR